MEDSIIVGGASEQRPLTERQNFGTWAEVVFSCPEMGARFMNAVILRIPPTERFGVKPSQDLLTRVRREYPRIRVPCQDGRGRREVRGD